jgi:hypothetical protein
LRQHQYPLKCGALANRTIYIQENYVIYMGTHGGCTSMNVKWRVSGMMGLQLIFSILLDYIWIRRLVKSGQIRVVLIHVPHCDCTSVQWTFFLWSILDGSFTLLQSMI